MNPAAGNFTAARGACHAAIAQGQAYAHPHPHPPRRWPMNWHWFVAPGSALYLLPLACAMGLATMVQAPGAWGPVLRWWLAVATACLLTAASKISFYGWGTGVRAWDLTCFSGHTALAFAVWPVVLMLAVPPDRPAGRLVGLVAGTVLAGLIGYSRVPLGAHPVSEVIAGALLGATAGGVGARALRRRGPSIRMAPLLVAVLILALALPGRRLPLLPSERWFADVGVALSGRDKPVKRKKWRDVTDINISHKTNLRR